MAKKLLDRFGNIQSILSASGEDLVKVEGIGNKTVGKTPLYL